MTLTHAEAGHRLGMPEREVVDVVETGGGHAVRTHDGTWTLVADDGLVFNVADPAAPADKELDDVDEVPVDEDGPPLGGAQKVLDWVAGDPVRAQRALNRERDQGAQARSTLVAALERLVAV